MAATLEHTMPPAADIGISAVTDIVPDGTMSVLHGADPSREDAAAEAAAIAAATSRADADEGAPNMRGVCLLPGKIDASAMSAAANTQCQAV